MKEKERILLCFDMDGVLSIPRSSWSVVHKALGTEKEARNFSNLFYAKKIDYATWAQLDVQLWKKKNLTAHLYTEIISSIPLRENLKVLTHLKAQKKNLTVVTAIISAGLASLAQRINRATNGFFDAIYANKIVFNSKHGLIENAVVRVPHNKKGKILSSLKRKFRIDKTIAIGDGPSDKNMFEIADVGILFNPHNEDNINADVNFIIRENSLVALTDLLREILE